MGYLAVIYLTPRTGKHPEDLSNDILHCTLFLKFLAFLSKVLPQWETTTLT